MRSNPELPALSGHSLSEQIYGHLKTAILSGHFRPGERLVPEELATQFRVSMTPIRDALKELENDGLITIVARRGVFITEITAKEVREIFQIRQIIEQAAVEDLTAIADSTVVRLRELIEEMASLQQDDHYRDYLRYVQADAAFHHQIVAMLTNEHLSRFYESLRWPIQLLRVLSQAQYQRASQGHQEHQAIVAAIAQGDAAAARAAVGEHLGNACDDLLRRLPPEK